MSNLGVGAYVPGQGYVSNRGKRLAADAAKAPAPKTDEKQPAKPLAATGNPIQEVLTKVFGTVPRNKLKEAGLDDE